MKFSSTAERPNRFVDRSLPFFVPPAQPLETYDDEFSESLAYDDYDSSTSEGDISVGKRERRRKRSRESRWAEQDARAPHQRGHSEEEALEGGGGEESTDGATRILEDAAGSDEDETNIFLRDASATKGIHCRLGMDGVMSEGHYDGSRNMVALLAGKRRWILSDPRNCAHMHMFRKGHPSARHTSADWTDPNVASQFPDLQDATANEVILRAGEALFVPEHWIHSIVNIGVSAQCNSRSGKSHLYRPIIRACERNARAE
ncbi:unnamed protein product [Ectocarpus fasciculatus]